jgi:hypothetical protein
LSASDGKARTGFPFERLAALLPIVVACLCTAVGIATSGWGYPTKTPPIDPATTRLIPLPPLVDGKPPPPKTIITPTRQGSFRMLPLLVDGGAPDARP